MDAHAITEYVAATFGGVDVVVASKQNGAPEVAWGDTFFTYDPDRALDPARRFPFATIVTKNYPGFDEASDLNRPGVFRLNIGVSRDTFQALFGNGHDDDFAALDRLMPHPVYATNNWISVLNPSESTFEAVKPLLAEATHAP
jgi:hypothetical protein